MYRPLPLLAALFALVAGAAHASGFALIEQNASGLGNAYAGAAAVAEDASTVHFNPAGMSRLPKRQLVVALNAIKPRVEFSGSAVIYTPAPLPVGGGQGGDAGDWAWVPNLYYTQRLTPSLTAGLGLNAPFGLKTSYDPGWIGRYQAIESEVRTINLNPSLAWKISDTLSVGAGLNLQRIEAVLSNRIPLYGQPLVRIEGEDYGFGYDLGVLWQATPATRIGLAYRSAVDYKLDGKSRTADPVVAPLNGPVTARLTLPDSASLSLVHRLSPRWEFLADLSWTGWSDFDVLPIVGTVNKTTVENWGDILRYSLGLTWRVGERLRLRGGLAHEEAVVSDAFRTARIPDGARNWLALGGQYRLSPQATLDFGYAHLFVHGLRLDHTDNGTRLAGVYDNAADILSVQYSLNF